MSIFFTSDPHFGHKNIIKYTNRPFNDIEDMDYKLVKNWNNVVSKSDTTYIIGDFSFHKDFTVSLNILKSLNGKKILIRGNHDKHLHQTVLNSFDGVHDYCELYVNDKDAHHGRQMIVLLHYSMRVWNKSHHGSWHLYGHSHGSLQDDKYSLSFDVGVDCHEYKPISYDDVKLIMSKKEFKKIDYKQEL